MSFWYWVIILTHQVSGIVTGEISIRYGEWLWAIRKETIVLKHVITGIVVIATAAFALQVQYLAVQLQPENVKHLPLSYGYVSFEITRAVFIIGFAYLTYPIAVVHYGQNRREALSDLLVRLFLISFSFAAGVACTLTYLYGHVGP